jgi:hypothetical protein
LFFTINNLEAEVSKGKIVERKDIQVRQACEEKQTVYVRVLFNSSAIFELFHPFPLSSYFGFDRGAGFNQ